MQGKPPPNQAAKGTQPSPAGMAPPTSQGPLAAGPSGGLQGLRPPEGATTKGRGRGGSGSELSDVRWGMIFKLGWKLLGFFKVLTVGYCIMMLVQNCVTLGTSQLMGEVTNAIRSAGAPRNPEPAANTTATAPTISATAPGAPATPPAPKKSPLFLVVLWSALALAMLAVRLPMRAVATKLDLAL